MKRLGLGGMMVAGILFLSAFGVAASPPGSGLHLPPIETKAWRRVDCGPWKVVGQVEYCSYDVLVCMLGDYPCLERMRRIYKQRTCKVYECRSIWMNDCYLVGTRVERDSDRQHVGCCNICVMKRTRLGLQGRPRLTAGGCNTPAKSKEFFSWQEVR